MMTGSYADLRDKTFLVTGASSGIGAAISLALAKQGAKLLLTGRDELRLKNIAAEAASSSYFIADLSIEKERRSLSDNLKSIDGICHCAGISSPFPAKFLTENKMTEVMGVNFYAPSLLTSMLLHKKKINNGGAIVFVSSIASEFAYKGGAVYSASKSALEAYSRNIAIEQAPQNIRANCIKPGIVRTAIYDETAKLYGDKLMSEHDSSYPLGVGEPEDVASLALFLLSKASRWITGTSITLDGGLTAGK